jgi:hypothetical protein
MDDSAIAEPHTGRRLGELVRRDAAILDGDLLGFSGAVVGQGN